MKIFYWQRPFTMVNYSPVSRVELKVFEDFIDCCWENYLLVSKLQPHDCPFESGAFCFEDLWSPFHVSFQGCQIQKIGYTGECPDPTSSASMLEVHRVATSKVSNGSGCIENHGPSEMSGLLITCGHACIIAIPDSFWISRLSPTWEQQSWNPHLTHC